jgi:orotidine-5'-phosphate decarboxylase
VRAAYGNALAVLVAGIRRAGGEAHDQARVTTPEGAVAAGASYLVLGRAVTEARDPAGELRAILEEMATASA